MEVGRPEDPANLVAQLVLVPVSQPADTGSPVAGQPRPRCQTCWWRRYTALEPEITHSQPICIPVTSAVDLVVVFVPT